MIRDMRIGHKILLINLLAVLFLVGLTVTNYSFLRDINLKADKLYRDDYLPTTWIAQIDSGVHTMNDRLLEVILSPDVHYREVLVSEIGKVTTNTNQILGQYAASVQGDPVGELWMSKLTQSLSGYRAGQKKVLDLVAAGQEKEAYQIYKTVIKSKLDDISGYIGSLQADRLETSGGLNQERQQLYARLLVILISASLLAICAFAALGRWIAQLIVRPLGALQGMMAEAEAGRLAADETAGFASRDEVGRLHRSFHAMTGSLHSLIGHVQSGSQLLAQQAEQFTSHAEQSKQATESIAVAADTLAQGTQSQVAQMNGALHAMQDVRRELPGVRANSAEMAQLADVAAMESVAASAHEAAASSQDTASANEEQLAMMEEILVASRSLQDMAGQLRAALVGFQV